ncbi:MAG: hypothetical protein IAF38_06345 [Bacteroidia bacterium]|nr:hypothetical protein [Bacteroidia bacterium]
MYQLYEYLKEEKICLSYLGSFNDEITDKLIGLSENYLGSANQLSKLKNKVSFLIAECFQNVVRHGGAKEAEKITVANHKDFFQINVFEDRVVLSSSNLIMNQYVEDLEKKITQVNSLGGDELKKLHNELLEHQEFSSKGGAGLGLIDMARKSGLPLKNHFNPLTKDHSEFFLGLEIVNNKENSTAKINIDAIKEFYDQLVKKNILILYKGDFSKDSISSLIEMLQNNFIESGTLSSKNVKSIITLIEVLQNVSKHGKMINGSKEGIFSISESTEGFVIECGNFIEKENLTSFKSSIDFVKSKSFEEIVKLYKKKLVEPEITEEGNCGLGLLEIARNSGTNFTYEFIETPEKEVFFSIKINP